MGPLGTLRERIEETFAKHGLTVQHFAVMPGTSTEGPHETQILATLGPSSTDVVDDGEFDRVVTEARDAELEQRSMQARFDLERRLKGNGGFL